MEFTARKSVVSFAPQAELYKTLHVKEYTDDEYASTWYNAKEIAAVKAECTSTVELIERHIPLNVDEYCARGLEYRTYAGRQLRHMNKINGKVSVLNEQERQYEENVYNPEALSLVYKYAARHCQEEAHQLALRDALYVRVEVMPSCQPTEEHEAPRNQDRTEESENIIPDNTKQRKTWSSTSGSISSSRPGQRNRHDSSNRGIMMLAIRDARKANRIMCAAA